MSKKVLKLLPKAAGRADWAGLAGPRAGERCLVIRGSSNALNTPQTEKHL